MTKKVLVRKRTSGSVGYEIPELRVSRSWNHNIDVPISVPVSELFELMSVPGGRTILEDYLLIEDEEVRREIFGYDTQPEYDYTEIEIEYILQEGSLDQLSDCLDFAPKGVLDLIKDMAVKKKPNTTAKVDLINKKFNISLDRIIENSQKENNLGEDSSETTKPQRKAEPIAKKQPIKYKEL